MAVTVSGYNHTRSLIITRALNTRTLKLQLLNDSATFVATHTQLTQVNNAGAFQVSGNGWTVGGITLANKAVAIVSTNGARLTADNISVTASGGAIGPAFKAVLFDDDEANDAPLLWFDLGGSQTAQDTKDFDVNWNANGIMRLLAPV